MSVEELRTLFLSQLSDLYAVECLTLVEKERFKAVSNDLLVQKALEKGMEDARESKRRIEAILIEMGIKPTATPHSPFKRMIQETLAEPGKYVDQNVQDTALIAMIQRLLNLEIAIYGTLIDLGKQLGLLEASSYLKQSVREKCSLESELNRIAVGGYFMPGLSRKATDTELVFQTA